jgi:hypothetical protein
MNSKAKIIIDRFVSIYAEYNSMDLKQAMCEFEDYGLIDYVLKWHYVIGHAHPEQIAKRLNGMVANKKNIRNRFAYTTKKRLA